MKFLLYDREISSDAIKPESVTLMTDSALLHPGNPLFVPDFAPEFVIELMPAAVINRLGKNIPEKFADRYYSSLTFLARVVPVIDGMPCRHGSPSVTNFDNAVIAGATLPVSSLPPSFTLCCNGTPFEFNTVEARFDKAIEISSANATLKIGDIIATGRFGIAIPAEIGTRVELTIPSLSENILRFKIK